jgi:serine/threonine protein kinase
MLHDFEGSQALVYVRNGSAVRRPKKTPAAQLVRTKAWHVLLSLSHPNLVRILNISTDGDMHMEPMQISLQGHMLRAHSCSASVKLDIARHVASALQYLHLHHMQHEDLCPNNILLAWQHGEMLVKLCDFYNEQAGCHRTAAYAAPEVVLLPARDVSAAADVWAFGCCVLFMEGAEPFAGFEHAAAILLHLGQHLCVAFLERSTVVPFTLHDCAYGPARHLAHSMWADVLADIFNKQQASRPSSLELQQRLLALRAPSKHGARRAPTRLDFLHG